MNDEQAQKLLEKLGYYPFQPEWILNMVKEVYVEAHNIGARVQYER